MNANDKSSKKEEIVSRAVESAETEETHDVTEPVS